MKPMKFGIGQAVKRAEDARLIRGEGKYTADVVPAGSLAAVFLRSPHAQARFKIEDVAAAKAAPGVRLVVTSADVGHLGNLPCLATLPNSDGSQTPPAPYPVLAKDVVLHVGDALAMIVAETEAQAREAA